MLSDLNTKLSYAIVAGVLGLLVGSAINAVVWRLYTGRSWVKGRSMCPDCKHTLAARDLVPVVSWLWLRGRCRYCGKRIHWQYPVVELVTAAAFALSAFIMASTLPVDLVRMVFWLAILTLLLVLAVFDARWMILPDKVMIPLIVLSALKALTMTVLTGQPEILFGGLAAALLGGGMFFVLAEVKNGKYMGGGDIKLVFAMGLILGMKALMVALLLAFNAGALFGLVLWAVLAAKQRNQAEKRPSWQKLKEARIAFGPFLVGGTIAAYLYGSQIIDWYLRLNGLT